jgi:U3 small nucleolar RNA-associated protein 14
MAPQTKAAWIRRIFAILLFGGAAAAGAFFVMPDGWKKEAKDTSTAVQITKENIDKIQGKPGVLTITNMRLDGNPDSKKLQEILEELKKNKYGEKVQLAEVDIEKELQIATEAGVVDLEQFAGHLDFHTEGRKLGDLVAETDPKVVEATIDRMLAGMVRRIDKNWLPDVPGMQRDRGQPVLPIKPAVSSR